MVASVVGICICSCEIERAIAVDTSGEVEWREVLVLWEGLGFFIRSMLCYSFVNTRN